MNECCATCIGIDCKICLHKNNGIRCRRRTSMYLPVDPCNQSQVGVVKGSAQGVNASAQSKIDYTMLPWVGVTEVARVLQDPRGSLWRTHAPTEILKSLLRHVFAVATQGIDAVDNDGKLHLAKIGARCLMILEVRCITAKDADNTATTTLAPDAGAPYQKPPH